MTLLERLNEDLKNAMRAKDEHRLSVLRMVRAGAKNVEVAQGKALDEPGLINVIRKEVRERQDSLAEFKKANRTDLVEKEELELGILLEYLPQQMSQDGIRPIAQEVIAQLGASGIKDKGKVMPVIMERIKGQADGRDVNAVVTALLEAAG